MGQTEDTSVCLDDPALAALLYQMAEHPTDYGQAHRAWLEAGWCERHAAASGARPPDELLDAHGRCRCVQLGVGRGAHADADAPAASL